MAHLGERLPGPVGQIGRSMRSMIEHNLPGPEGMDLKRLYASGERLARALNDLPSHIGAQVDAYTGPGIPEGFDVSEVEQAMDAVRRQARDVQDRFSYSARRDPRGESVRREAQLIQQWLDDIEATLNPGGPKELGR